MPVTDIALGKGEVLIIQAASILGATSLSPATLQFGQVASVSDTTDNVTVGTSVLFDPSKASQLMYGSTIYFKIDEQYVSGNEGTPP